MDPLFSNSVPVNGIYRCGYRGHTILGCDFYTNMWPEIVHCFLAAIFLMLQWLLSAMPLLDGMYAYCSCSRTPHFCKNCLTCWLQKAGSLLADISSSALHLKKIDDSWQIMLDECCRAINLQTAKYVGPQSIRVRKWLPL